MKDHPVIDTDEEPHDWKPADLAAAHRDVLTTVAELTDEEPPTGTEIGEACHIDTDHLYHILQVLEDEGLLTRERDQHDHRVLRNSLTDEGRAMLEALCDRYTALEVPGPLALETPRANKRSDNPGETQ
jgi:DNA-binding MarR family transcriptional regulator